MQNHAPLSSPSASCLHRAATAIQSAVLRGARPEEACKAVRAVMEDWRALGMEALEAPWEESFVSQSARDEWHTLRLP